VPASVFIERREAAAILGTTREHVEELVAAGDLPRVPGKAKMLHRVDVIRYRDHGAAAKVVQS
jgi:hypothetical protein